jgi:hypothetical protein
MTKNAVYSWRIAAERKAELENAARRKRRPLAELLDEAVAQWLRRQTSGNDDDDEARVRSAAALAFGKLASGDPERASEARDRVRAKLKARTRG